ncbi:alpha/beta-hydrolase [Dentipellis sp. KUC8613]|nr:alpha/beta-hydrolase [Dentipellis sp. KUC8613]
MDPSTYKSHTTRRGLTWKYHFSPPSAGKPTLVLLHGFPSSAQDWTHQVAHFSAQGAGLLVPDMLGHGASDKPTDAALYTGSGLAGDVVELMDKEGVKEAVLVGHDWGCRVASRLLNLHADRVAGVAFLGASYVPPDANFDPQAANEFIKGAFGRELLGYFEFLSAPGTDKLIEQNIDSFLGLFFPNPPELWIEHVGPSGAARAWVESNRQSAAPAYFCDQVRAHYKTTLLAGGLAAPLCYYTVNALGLNSKDDALVPASAYEITKPVFFAAANKDFVALPQIGDFVLQKYAKGPLTRREFDADHWIMMSHSPELNKALDEWLVEQKFA